jgi:hypothetical protein
MSEEVEEEELTEMDRIVKHTRGLQSDLNLTSGEAAAKMADGLDDYQASDIIREL